MIGGAVVSKTCTALKRKLRHFAKQPSGAADFRVYSSPEEMIEFFDDTLWLFRCSAIRGKSVLASRRPPSLRPIFRRHVEDQRVSGFILMKQDRPVAYVCCWINQDIVTYSYCGYNPDFRQVFTWHGTSVSDNQVVVQSEQI